MSTRFFERQRVARRNTAWLVAMFVLCTIVIVSAVTVVAIFASTLAVERPAGTSGRAATNLITRDNLMLGALAAGSTTLLILCGTAGKIVTLRFGGGRGVAESVGGRPIPPDTRDPDQRRILNVVEEMAIASGTPVPPVYRLDEPAINAFAAGYTPSDAVIGVTDGCVRSLNRDQLQGVVAHEFSHILNGDMRMNIRMIGILHGILLLFLIGRMLVQSMHFTGHRSRRGSRDGGDPRMVILLVGVSLMAIGWIGWFLGGLLKAAVSRQREYLADASAVQFTRNPDGIAGALKHIAALTQHGKLNHRDAAIASHMYFADGLGAGLSGLTATHPPLPDRIRAIEPNWDGRLPRGEIREPDAGQPRIRRTEAASGFAGETAADGPTRQPPAAGEDSISLAAVRTMAERIGDADDGDRRAARQLIDSADSALVAAARDPYSARALLFALLLDSDNDIRATQLKTLQGIIETHLVTETARLVGLADRMPDELRLPLVDLSMPALAAMSRPQYDRFVTSFRQLIAADRRLSLFEWVLSQVLLRHLHPRFHSIGRQVTRYYGLGKLGDELSLLISAVAYVGHGQDDVAASAFDVGARDLPIAITRLPRESCSLDSLEAALGKLNFATERLRGQIVDACAACVCADGEVRVREAELIRGIADLLGCPVPPLRVKD